ncbi:hypothetical protein N7495_008398 [Penicillium taxi]|uniref:uncharacterized protein n=1 Tax=Penicillium taxi TaxID=168475 RepID=UPI00254573C1|nr:uncharacterized protein N7495_008398 [Penicillium taxi]KAJ5888357.1 hypothetical protein N7495_008398 [Penicillium taxi]
MDKLACRGVPKLQCFKEGIQDQNSIIPSGYIIHLVWEKFPGGPLDEENFWSLNPAKRRIIRDKFRIAFKHLNGYHVAWRITFPEKWEKGIYVMYGLAEIDDCLEDWWNHPDEWRW